MKNLIFLLIFALLLFVPKSILAQSDWIQINSGFTEYSLNSIQFVNANTGFIVAGGGLIIKTTNGGTIWEQKTSGLTSGLNNVHFMNAQTGIAVGSFGRIIRTTNGGDNWTMVSTTTGEHLAGISFVDAMTGYVAGMNTTLVKTTDGGLTWETKSSGGGSTYFDCHFFNSNTGLVTNYSVNIKKTTNSGSNWTVVYNLSGFIMNDLYFVNQIIGFAAGSDGMIVKTTNSGDNWEISQSAGKGYSISEMCFVNETLGYAVGRVPIINSGVIIRTSNGGNNWVNEANLTKGLSGVTFNNGYIFAVGDSGKVWRTENPIGIQNINSEIPKNFSLSQNYPNPFNPTTNIEISVRKSENVKLVVYDITGKEVETLVNQTLTPGIYKIDFNASKLSSGTYFYRLQTDDFVQTKKMVLVK